MGSACCIAFVKIVLYLLRMDFFVFSSLGHLGPAVFAHSFVVFIFTKRHMRVTVLLLFTVLIACSQAKPSLDQDVSFVKYVHLSKSNH